MQKPSLFYVIVFRVIGGDVYEIPVYASNRYNATSRALAFIGVKRHQVIECAGDTCLLGPAGFPRGLPVHKPTRSKPTRRR